MKDHIRQGDVLTIEVDSMPDDASIIKKENGRVVLAHGEVTGHAHAFNTGARLYSSQIAKGATKERPARFLRLLKTSDLSHEEHTKIPHEKGLRRVIRQTEYSPEELRVVAD